MIAIPMHMNINIIDMPMNPYYSDKSKVIIEYMSTNQARHSFLELAAVQPIDAVNRRQNARIVIAYEI